VRINNVDRLYKSAFSSGNLTVEKLAAERRKLGFSTVSDRTLLHLAAVSELWNSLGDPVRRQIPAFLVFGSTAEAIAGVGDKIAHQEIYRKGKYAGSFFFRTPRFSDIDVKLFLRDPAILYSNSQNNEEKKRKSSLFNETILPKAQEIENKYGVSFSFILMHPDDASRLLSDSSRFQFWRRYYLLKPFVVVHNRSLVNKLRRFARAHEQKVDAEAWFDREGKREILAVDRMKELGTDKVFFSAEEMANWRSKVYSQKPPRMMLPLKPDKFKQR